MGWLHGALGVLEVSGAAMSPLPGGFSKTAAAADATLQRQLLAQARKVARLMEQRRKYRRHLRDIEGELRQERRFLKAMVEDKANGYPPARGTR